MNDNSEKTKVTNLEIINLSVMICGIMEKLKDCESASTRIIQKHDAEYMNRSLTGFIKRFDLYSGQAPVYAPGYIAIGPQYSIKIPPRTKSGNSDVNALSNLWRALLIEVVTLKSAENLTGISKEESRIIEGILMKIGEIVDTLSAFATD